MALPTAPLGDNDSFREQKREREESLNLPILQESFNDNVVTLEEVEQSDEEWAIDKRTGRKYRKLPANSSAAIIAGSKGGLSLDQMFQYTELEEDFDLDDLNASADLFLAHLRVPPNKEEQERLKEEKIRMRREQEKKYSEMNSEEEE